MKTAATLMAALMALMALAPVASADNPGDLSRTFLSSMNIEWKPHSTNPGDGIGGAGWYHPDNRDDLCFLRLFGFSDAAFYYQTLRVTSNINVHLAHVSELTVPGDPCPFDSTLPAGQVIGTSAFNVWAPAFGVEQSALLCTKTFSLCAPDPGTANWSLYYCGGYDTVTFQKGDILGIYPIVPPAPTIGASSVGTGCTGAFGYDATGRLSSQLDNLASLDPIHIDEFSPNGDATTTSYWMSCFFIDIRVFPEDIVRRSRTHDWFLVLDGDDSGNWADALLYHSMAPTDDPKTGKKYPTPPNSIAKQGLYDLSGDNGCKNTEATTPLPDDKPKDAPLVSL